MKALSDWVVTSSIALPIVEHLAARGEKILWAPDKYLGDWIQNADRRRHAVCGTARASCTRNSSTKALADLKAVYPDAGVLVHPESRRRGDRDRRCGRLDQRRSSKRRTSCRIETFIVATDRGIFHKMRKEAPGKRFIEAPTAGKGATCRSCAHCPWMAMNELRELKRRSSAAPTRFWSIRKSVAAR